MCKKLTVILGVIAMLGTSPLNAQAPDTLWTKTYGSPGGEYGASVIQTNDLGFMIAGSTNPFEPDSCPDLYLIKTDPEGELSWDRTYGLGLSEYGRCVRQTSDGGYIAVGETESYGGGEMDYPDIYLIKTDSTGEEQWHRTFGGPGMDIGYDIEQTADGGFIVVGELDNCADLYLLKTDSSGYEEWARTYGFGCCVGYCVRQTADLGYIIAGSDYTTNGPYYGGYLLKVDSLGDEQWSSHYDSYDAKMIYCVQPLGADGYILAGALGDGDDFDIFLKKVSLDGGDEWTRYFPIGHWDFAYSVRPAPEGGYVIAGSSDYRITGASDGYIFKTDAAGELQWDLTLGGDGSDIIRSLEQTVDGGYIACGFTRSDDLPPSQDIWLIRINSEGVPIEDSGQSAPVSFALYQAYPNPFNARVTVGYYLPRAEPVSLVIYNLLGQAVATVFEGRQDAGWHQVTWDGAQQASGVYFYKLQAGEFSQMRKMVLLK